MKRVLLSISAVTAALLLFYALGRDWLPAPAPVVSSAPVSPAGLTGLPGRDTATPARVTLPVHPTVVLTPLMTSPFTFPTRPPDISPTPASDCTPVFPIESVERIDFGETTVVQLEATFGRAGFPSGRPPRLRFEDDGCVLLVTLGTQEALEAELIHYGSLGWLLGRYGPPDAVGISQGNLTLLTTGNAVLLYPDRGVIAIFDAGPDEISRATTIGQLIFRPPYTADKQITRLNLGPVENWIPPLR
jgi:hypothetical protein